MLLKPGLRPWSNKSKAWQPTSNRWKRLLMSHPNVQILKSLHFRHRSPLKSTIKGTTSKECFKPSCNRSRPCSPRGRAWNDGAATPPHFARVVACLRCCGGFLDFFGRVSLPCIPLLIFPAGVSLDWSWFASGLLPLSCRRSPTGRVSVCWPSPMEHLVTLDLDMSLRRLLWPTCRVVRPCPVGVGLGCGGFCCSSLSVSAKPAIRVLHGLLVLRTWMDLIPKLLDLLTLKSIPGCSPKHTLLLQVKKCSVPTCGRPKRLTQPLSVDPRCPPDPLCRILASSRGLVSYPSSRSAGYPMPGPKSLSVLAVWSVFLSVVKASGFLVLSFMVLRPVAPTPKVKRWPTNCWNWRLKGSINCPGHASWLGIGIMIFAPSLLLRPCTG